ncbi:MAG: copA [Planctomycetaceae bacterium]|nr:copA [Planctomycetaceae bacterium]
MNQTVQESACDFCGLPVLSRAVAQGPVYCCIGCRIAARVTQSSGESGGASWMLARLAAAIFCTINVTVCTMVLWSNDFYPISDPSRLNIVLDQLLRYTALVFALPVWFWLGQSLWTDAWRELRHGRFSTDFLFLTGILAAYVSSCVSVLRGTGDLYFEVACVVLVLLTLGRWFEAQSKVQATAVLDRMQKLLPDTVRRWLEGKVQVIPAADARQGDELQVLAGERFPTDGILLSPRVTIDTQFLTGESWPIERVAGSPIAGGSLNLDGDVRFQASAPISGGTLARMMHAVRDARLRKGAYQQMAERLSHWFTPLILLIALMATGIHTVLSGWETGLLTGLSVLLIACPCALGLAAPLAIWVALGRAAERQILFRSGEALERLAEIHTIAFDKTGTLTTGQPLATHIVGTPDVRQSRIQQCAVSLARSSTHPFSQAIVEAWGSETIEVPLHEVLVVSGRGISGVLSESVTTVRLGSSDWLRDFVPESEWRQPWISEVDSTRPQVWLAFDSQLWGVIQFREELRPEAPQMCQEMTRRGLKLVVLSGDRRASANILAESLLVEIHAELTPEGKQAAVAELRRQGPVLVVGDGINDAPALAAADVGMAMSCGTDVARAAAEICLLSDQLDRIPWAYDLAQSTVQTIRRNLAWAFGYNGVGVVLAACGWMNPMLAALLMTGSSLAVIFRSLRLAEFPVPSPPNTTAFNGNSAESPIQEETAGCGTGF